MSLREILAERNNPGPVGDVEFGRPVPHEGRSRTAVLLRGTIAIALLLAWLTLTCALVQMDVFAVAITLILTYGYLWTGYHVRPRPDDRNLGLMAGLIDHPFRISDDINRLLVILWLFLLPGRFIAQSLIELARRRFNRSAPATSLRHP
jgi:hypothetical protein